MLFDKYKRLDTVHEDLRKVVEEASKYMDIIVVCGYRSKEEQDKAFASGNSKVRFPNSKHNVMPSNAVDCAPCNKTGTSINWMLTTDFKKMGKILKAAAIKLGVEVEWGGDWKKFKDYPHLELKE